MGRVLDIGALKHRVRFEAALPIQISNDGGRIAEQLVHIDTWAAIEMDSVRGSDALDQRQTTERLSVTLRYRPDLNRDYLMRWRGAAYRIEDLRPDDIECTWLKISCAREV